MLKERVGNSRLLKERQVVRARLATLDVAPKVRAELRDQEEKVVEVVSSFLCHVRQARLSDVYSPVWVVKSGAAKKNFIWITKNCYLMALTVY